MYLIKLIGIKILISVKYQLEQKKIKWNKKINTKINLKSENKQENFFFFFLQKNLTQLEINPDKQDHPNPNNTMEINNVYYEWTSPMIL